jgi:radical SAM protein with 4Fe4S-binding SPASM domain
MGEPLLNPHLQAMVDICHEHDVRIFLVSNGVLLKEKQSEILLHPAFRQVNFSLHSFNDNFPDRDPTDYLNKIFSYTEQALIKRPDLYLNFRLWNLQDPRGASISNSEMLQRIADRFQVKIDTSIDVRSRKSIHLKDRLYLHFDTEFIWPSLDLPVLGSAGSCYGLSSHFGILVDGTVVPCCLDKEAAIPLGQISDQPLEDILNSPRALQMLEGFRRKKLIENLCQRCQYIERFKETTPSTKATK